MDASATLSYQPEAGGVFNYTLTLNNLPTSTDQIQTFWYSWIPGLDFMTANPISETAPTGWGILVENGAYYGGYSIQFTTTTASLSPGASIQFGFRSLATPDELSGPSPVFFNYYLESTSYVYSQSIENGDSEQFNVETIPEPSTLALVTLGTILGVIGIICRKLCIRNPAPVQSASRLSKP